MSRTEIDMAQKTWRHSERNRARKGNAAFTAAIDFLRTAAHAAGRQIFEPAHVRLEAYERSTLDIVDMQYGLVCYGEDEPCARSIVDLTLGPSPVNAVDHPNQEAGVFTGSPWCFNGIRIRS
jgi:hypothetical protein